MTTPLAILRESIRSVPAVVKYALGVAGLASVIAIVRALTIDYRVAVFGTVLLLLLMTLLVLFARLSSITKPGFRLLAMVFTWFTSILVIAAALAMFLSVFFRWPLDLQDWIKDSPSVSPTLTGKTHLEDCVRGARFRSLHSATTRGFMHLAGPRMFRQAWKAEDDARKT